MQLESLLRTQVGKGYMRSIPSHYTQVRHLTHVFGIMVVTHWRLSAGQDHSVLSVGSTIN